eukprot:gene7969-10809_t
MSIIITSFIFALLGFILYYWFKGNAKSLSYVGKHILVTGGSSGIGLEIAKEYLKRGAHVTIAARDVKKLQYAVDIQLKPLLNSALKQLVGYISVDLSSSENEVQKSLNECIRERGDVFIAVLSAGTSVAGEFDQIDIQEFERMYRINVLGSVYPARVVLPGMKRKGEGKIIFVASQIAQAPLHGYTAYAASKWALRGLAESLQMEVKPYGIQIAVAYPPDTDTPGYEVEMQSKPELTKKLSESGAVFTANDVALSIIDQSEKNYFSLTTGLDGFLLKQVHPGMSPINNWVEVTQQVLLSSLVRIVSVFYILDWDKQVAAHVETNKHTKNK